MLKNFVDINGFHIEYFDSMTESDETLFFVHGLGGNIKQWKRQIAYFEKDYRVIAISLQGHGNSSKNLEASAYSIEVYRDIAVALLKKLKVTSCIWIGNSMGGVIGYSALDKHPRMIKHLITNGTTPMLRLSKLSVLLMAFIDRLLMKILGFKGYVKFAAKHATHIESVKSVILDFMKQTGKKAILVSHETLNYYDYQALLKESPFKITIIKGGKDQGINKYLKKCDLSDIQIIYRENAGHIYNVENPEGYNKTVESIIKKKAL